jgi:hypothetical protein
MYAHGAVVQVDPGLGAWAGWGAWAVRTRSNEPLLERELFCFLLRRADTCINGDQTEPTYHVPSRRAGRAGRAWRPSWYAGPKRQSPLQRSFIDESRLRAAVHVSMRLACAVGGGGLGGLGGLGGTSGLGVVAELAHGHVMPRWDSFCTHCRSHVITIPAEFSTLLESSTIGQTQGLGT